MRQYWTVLFYCGFNIAVARSGFTVVDLEGHSHSLSHYSGKWVVVNFWATWCSTCVAEIPDFVAFHRAHYPKDAIVLGMDLDDEASDVEIRAFAKRHRMNYPLVRPTTEVLQVLGPVTGVPTTYLIDPNGYIAGHQVGPVTRSEIEGFIDQYQYISKK